MRKTKQCAFAFATLGFAVVASAQDVDRYRYFRDEGIFDQGVSNETAYAIVRDGVASSDPAIVDLTIKALGLLAATVTHGLPSSHGPSLPPGLFRRFPA